MNNSMKAVQINGYGGNEVVLTNDVALPLLGPNQVLVEIHAAAINPVDWKIREGHLHQMAPLTFPATLGSDFSGIITKLGVNVTTFKVGDEIFGQAGHLTGGSGTFAEVASADINKIILKPDNLSHIEAAALPLAALTAIQAIYDNAKLARGQKILIHGGTGGVGSSAIQIAKNLGAFVTTTVNGKNLERAKHLGADLVIDYTTGKFEDLLRDYDIVFDTVGGEIYTKSFQVLKPHGLIISLTEQPNHELETKFQVNAIFIFTNSTAKNLNILAELTEQGVLNPLLDKTFSLQQTKEALDYQQNGHPQGKVTIKIR